MIAANVCLQPWRYLIEIARGMIREGHFAPHILNEYENVEVNNTQEHQSQTLQIQRKKPFDAEGFFSGQTCYLSCLAER